MLAREKLLDRDFLHAHTIGWDELEPLLADCTPEWGESTTGVPADLIELARKRNAALEVSPGGSKRLKGQLSPKPPTIYPSFNDYRLKAGRILDD